MSCISFRSTQSLDTHLTPQPCASSIEISIVFTLLDDTQKPPTVEWVFPLTVEDSEVLTLIVNVYMQNFSSMQKTSSASSTNDVVKNNANKDLNSPGLVEEWIRPKLELSNEQILSLTQLLNQLIQEKSSKTIPTARTCIYRSQMGPHINIATGGSKASPDMSTRGTKLSLDMATEVRNSDRLSLDKFRRTLLREAILLSNLWIFFSARFSSRVNFSGKPSHVLSLSYLFVSVT